MNLQEKEMFPFPVIRKRDGRLVRFDIEKIINAIHKAFYSYGVDDEPLCRSLADKVVKELLDAHKGSVPQVEDIQDTVERVLISEKYDKAAKSFILYRAKRSSIREGKSEIMDSVEFILEETRKTKKYGFNSPGVKMMKIASAASRAFYLTRIIPSRFAEAHNRGDIHIHDLEYYSKTMSSLQIPLYRLLSSGFQSGYGFIRPAKHVQVISALTAVIIQSCQNDLQGGQSIPRFDEQVGTYIQKHIESPPQEEETRQAMQGLVYNLNMLYSRLGERVPMTSINLGLDTSPEGRLVTKSLLEELAKGLGRGETPVYPWVVFHVKEGVNFNQKDPNYDLFELAVRTASRRMNPAFAFADSPVNGDGCYAAYWGDASRITNKIPLFVRNEEGAVTETLTDTDEGFGIAGQVTLNLPRLAFKIAHKRKDFLVESFHNEIRRGLELCAGQLLHRRDLLENLHVNELPFILGQKIYNGSQSLKWEDSIKTVLEQGILSIGFLGLAEALFILFGTSYAKDEKLLTFALETIDFMRDCTENLCREFDASFALSASSSGYAAHRFAILDRGEFSVVPHVNDKKYYTQGFSMQAAEKIPWAEKLDIEGQFHAKVPGGHFTFLESRGMPDFGTHMKVLRKMKESGIAYGGISFPLMESMRNGELISKEDKTDNQIRSIRRAAGLLLPISRINEGLIDELNRREFDL